MKKLNLNVCDVQEMSMTQMQKTEGGWIFPESIWEIFDGSPGPTDPTVELRWKIKTFGL